MGSGSEGGKFGTVGGDVTGLHGGAGRVHVEEVFPDCDGVGESFGTGGGAGAFLEGVGHGVAGYVDTCGTDEEGAEVVGTESWGVGYFETGGVDDVGNEVRVFVVDLQGEVSEAFFTHWQTSFIGELDFAHPWSPSHDVLLAVLVHGSAVIVIV